MKNTLLLMLPILTTLVIAAPPARALEIGVLGGLNISQTTADISPSTRNTKGTFNYGAFLDIPSLAPSPAFSVEIDALVLRRTQEINLVAASGTTTVIETKYHYLMIPAILRFTGIPLLSIGAGPYVAPSLEKAQITTGANSTATEADVSTDLGLVGSLQFKFPLTPFVHAIADARYVWGMKDLQGTDSKFRDYQGWAGISLGF